MTEVCFMICRSFRKSLKLPFGLWSLVLTNINLLLSSYILYVVGIHIVIHFGLVFTPNFPPAVVVPSWRHVWLFATPWTTECQAPLLPPSPQICLESCPLCGWCCLTILSSPAQLSFAFHLSQHQGLYQWVSFSHQVAKILEVYQQSFQWIFTFSLS